MSHVPDSEPDKLIQEAGLYAASRKAKERGEVHHTFRRIDIELLETAYFWLKREAAPGVDGATWKAYEANWEVNLKNLYERFLSDKPIEHCTRTDGIYPKQMAVCAL
ncbi:MAG: group intron reverse transcriptase/maturase [Solimicrobium sp.]|nr:group intron reverse transcriptase/maturase [Solimicrobium sp.]